MHVADCIASTCGVLRISYLHIAHIRPRHAYDTVGGIGRGVRVDDGPDPNLDGGDGGEAKGGWTAGSES